MKEPEGGEGRGCKHIWHPRNPADSHNITGGTHRPCRRESAVFLSCHRTCSGRHTHPRNCAPATSAMSKSDYVATRKEAQQFSSWWDVSMLAAIVLFIPPDKQAHVGAGRPLAEQRQRKRPRQCRDLGCVQTDRRTYITPSPLRGFTCLLRRISASLRGRRLLALGVSTGRRRRWLGGAFVPAWG